MIVSAANFIVFFAICWTFALKPVSEMLGRPQGADRAGPQGRRPGARDRAAPRRSASPPSAEARREANEILARAQKVAEETRDSDIAETRAEIERLREQAVAEIEAEKQRAIGRGPRARSPTWRCSPPARSSARP